MSAAHVPSFESINYKLRPSKSIERRMLADCLRRLRAFEPLRNYLYVGFGAIFFVDFALFHRTLGITDMLSIEREKSRKKRFEFNIPYTCVKIEFGESSEVLPKLTWKKRSIVWLDFDKRLSRVMLSDISYVAGLAPSGSVILVSVRARPDDRPHHRVHRLTQSVGADKVPAGVKFSEMADWGTAKLYARIIKNEIDEALIRRNGGVEADQKMSFKQLFNFHYADGAKMLSYGGVLHSAKEAALFDSCHFENDFDFIKIGTEPCLIEVPVLSLKELYYINSQLPDKGSLVSVAEIPKEDIERYKKIYKYFPHYLEAEI